MVSTAIAVSSSVASNNHVRFFALYGGVCAGRLPGAGEGEGGAAAFLKLARVLMDDAVERQRFRGLRVVCSAYRPTMPIAAVATQFGFRRRAGAGDNEEEEEEEDFECQDWLTAHGAVLTDRIEGDRFRSIDPKESTNRIFVPEKEEAVAHGDASLHASNFFAKNFSSL